MAVKLIAMDLDDTLLNNKRKVSFFNKLAIKRAIKKGIKIALASGRPTQSIIDVAKQIGIKENTYIISYNGGFVIDLEKDKVLFNSSLDFETFKYLYELSQKHNVFIHTYLNEEIVTEKINEYSKIESSITGLPLKEVSSLEQHLNQSSVVKVLMLEDPQKLKDVEWSLKPIVENRVTMFTSKPFFLEFMPNGVDKGDGLRKLANYLGIKQEEVMAIGDANNDISMLKWAGISVAMENANDEVKKIAKYITKSNENSGVSYAINKFALSSN